MTEPKRDPKEMPALIELGRLFDGIVQDLNEELAVKDAQREAEIKAKRDSAFREMRALTAMMNHLLSLPVSGVFEFSEISEFESSLQKLSAMKGQLDRQISAIQLTADEAEILARFYRTLGTATERIKQTLDESREAYANTNLRIL